MTLDPKETIIRLSEQYNDPIYFEKDPIIIPKHFASLYRDGDASLQDVEIAGIIAAHLAWGRRDMIIRDCNRAMDCMSWRPYDYVMGGVYRSDETSLHRTVKWSDFALICRNLKDFYSSHTSLEEISITDTRTMIFGQKMDKNAANKKINMFRRWMVRDDGIVDLGIWKKISKEDLLIPLDVHVHRSALNLGITCRTTPDHKCVLEITEYLKSIFPDDPCKGDFALFAYAASL